MLTKYIQECGSGDLLSRVLCTDSSSSDVWSIICAYPRGLPSASLWNGRRTLFCAEPHRRLYHPSHQDFHYTGQW
ncbi:hypothetical protein CY34DRAFT_441442 [Suillus luteus UH-Slu-Lm8-n1]|uniref:Uncharacterized protein n=1 Tax=Suillus luteus UH-Slu-Lm8-n1 TaxID=930992 RepID=A0A0D0B948_9AGAM|nr:hypothetical protein CY34DRAFT_441442 [Suillus luteus UH-Slu-Lm8-n1]